MSISPAEFRQSLTAMLGPQGFVAEEGGYYGMLGDGSWAMVLEPMPPLRIALLTLPRQRVHIRLEGVGDELARDFLARFELYFRRGGG